MTTAKLNPQECRCLLVRESYRFANQFNPLFEHFFRKQIQNNLLLERVLYAVSLIGVRERAFLTRISCQLCGVRWSTALPIALAAECFISSALTGDDVVDRADTRWRKPTVWKRWGDDQAWLVTEMLHALAHSAIDASKHAAAADVVRSSFNRFFEGQFREIACKKTHSRKDAVELAMERTGCLIEACLVAPALIADSRFRKPLSAFGKNFGTAFQLADDIYDFLGDPAVMGKPILGDLLNGQPNIVLAHALDQEDGPSKRMLAYWLGRGVENRPKNIGPILHALEALGSIDFAYDLVRSHLERAKKALECIPLAKPKKLLEGFLQLISVNDEQ